MSRHTQRVERGAAIGRVRRSTCTGGDVIDASRKVCSEKRIDDEFL
jgi:hypothetical protein